MLRSHDYKHNNVMHNFSVRPLYKSKANLYLIIRSILSRDRKRTFDTWTKSCLIFFANVGKS